jgi:hypothetical protein
MADAKAAWDEVGGRFADLAGRLKEQFDARSAFGTSANEKIDDAVRTLARALDDTITAIGDTLRDPSTRDDVKQAASAVGNAIASSFTEIAEQIRHFTDRSAGDAADKAGPDS